MIRHKKQVYSWFGELDSSSRVDFVCTILERFCNPFELRFFGTCLEQLARKDFQRLKELSDRANDSKQLREMTSVLYRGEQDITKVLYQGERIRSQLILAMCLLKSKPPDALGSTALYDILIQLEEYLRMDANSLKHDEKVIADIRLLLTIAIHHPAFSFQQRQDFEKEMSTFTELFGPLQSDQSCSAMMDAQCQTEIVKSEGKVLPADLIHNGETSPLPIAHPSSGKDGADSQTSKRNCITNLSVVSLNRSKSDVVYTIEVFSNGKVATVKKSHQDIKSLHSKLLQEFPEDVKAPKSVRHIPLLKAQDDGEQMIKVYLKDLCRMPSKYLDSKPVHDFFLQGNQSSSKAAASARVNSTSSNQSQRAISSSDCSVSDKTSISSMTSPNLSHEFISESDSGLPMQSIIVTNSTKYAQPTALKPSNSVTITPIDSLHHSARQLNSTSTMTSPRSPSQMAQNEMLLMTREDMKSKGMVEGAAKKLTEKLEVLGRNSGPGEQLKKPVHQVGMSQAKVVGRSQVSCDSSSSDVTSPRTSPYNRHKIPSTHHTIDVGHRQQLAFPDVAPSQNSTETRVRVEQRSEQGVQRSQSSHNLYSGSNSIPAPAEAANPMTVSVDASAWHGKTFIPSGQGSPSPVSAVPHRTQSEVSVVTVNQHAATDSHKTYPDSLNKHTKQPVNPSSASARSPRSPDSRPATRDYRPKTLRQRSEPGYVNGTSIGAPALTVGEIQNRQRKQRAQKAQPENEKSQSAQQPHLQPATGNHIRSNTAQTSTNRSPSTNSSDNISSPGSQLKPQQQRAFQQVKSKQPSSSAPKPQHGTQHKPQHSAPTPQQLAHPPQQPTPPPLQQLSPQHLTSPQQLAQNQQEVALQNATNYPARPNNSPQFSPRGKQNNPTPSPLSENPGGSDESEGFNVTEDNDNSDLTDCSDVMKQPASRHRQEVSRSAVVYTDSKQADNLAETLEYMSEHPSTAVIMQPADVQYYAQMNGLKAYAYSDIDRLIIPPGGDGSSYPANNCACAHCMNATQFYISVPQPVPGNQPPRPPARPPSHQQLPPMPPQQQNGIVYGYHGFVPTSNGLISPGLPTFCRSNSTGGPPNGMVQRNDIIYQPMPFNIQTNTNRQNYHAHPSSAGVGGVGSMVPPPHFQQLPPHYAQFYNAPPSNAFSAKRRVAQCTNCGASSHMRSECSEPGDNSNHNEYYLDIISQTELTE